MTTSSRRAARPRLAAAFAVAAALLASLSITAAPAERASAASPVQMTPALHAEIEQMVLNFQSANDLPGLSVAVVTPSATGSSPVITTFATGVQDLTTKVPVTATTQFELGSETKVFTADLLAYLLATGQVSLSDPLQKYAPTGVTIPDWIDPTTGVHTPITLRDLATHQAGLTDLPPNIGDGCGSTPNCDNPRPGYTQTMLWDSFQTPCVPASTSPSAPAEQCPLWKPGTKWLYSNWGFALLGDVLSNIIDPQPESSPPALQPALDGAFLNALGMSSTALETQNPRLATPYLPTSVAPYNTPTWYWNNINAFSGGGALISDADDMGTWVAAHLGYVAPNAPIGVRALASTLNPERNIATLCAEPDQCSDAAFQMGLGWQLYSATHQNVGVPWAFKDGGTHGSSTDTALAPSLRIGVTTMYNRARTVPSEQLAISVLAAMVASTSATPVPAPSPAASSPALASTGQPASHLLIPAVVALAFLAIGFALVVRRRRPRPTRLR